MHLGITYLRALLEAWPTLFIGKHIKPPLKRKHESSTQESKYKYLLTLRQAPD